MPTTTEATETGTPTAEARPINAGAAAVLSLMLETLDDAKAEDIVSIPLAGKSSIADQMIVASGRSHTHVGAIADRLLKALKKEGHGNQRVEGMPHCDWVLIDTGDVIVHIFRPEVRAFYNLEKMWSSDRPEDLSVVPS